MIGEWIWKDSDTGKTSSTKVIQCAVVFGLIALILFWAWDGQLTFEAAKDWVLWLYGVEKGGNVGVRAVKAYGRKDNPDDEPSSSTTTATEEASGE